MDVSKTGVYILLLNTLVLLVAARQIKDNVQSKVKVDSKGPRQPFVDEYGRIRVFHGLNRVQKGFPWYPSELLNKTHLDNLETWGFNVVRLGMMWSGVEIKPFVANQTYMDIMDGIIKSLSDRGVYVILDMHQDVLSSKFGSYDGAPLWLLNSFPPPQHAFPWPFSKKPSNWELQYVTTACGEAFSDLYSNKSGSLDHLSFFWQTVAKRFGKYNNVLGYEIINEPWPGDVITDPLLFVPGKTGSEILQPLYDTVFDAINRVDNRTLVFYEPVTWGMILHGSTLGSGFTHVPGGDKYKDRGVLSFHYYCWFAGLYNVNPFPWWLRTLCDQLFFPDVLKTITEDIKDTGGGAFLTEFGQCQATAAHNTTEYQECLSVLNMADPAFLSWTYWDSLFYCGNGSVNTQNVKLFSRTYAQAIAGTPLSSSFNSDTGSYTLSYTSNPKISMPTIIFASPLHYHNGYNVTTNTKYSIHQKNYIQVWNTASTAQTINVTISKIS